MVFAHNGGTRWTPPLTAPATSRWEPPAPTAARRYRVPTVTPAARRLSATMSACTILSHEALHEFAHVDGKIIQTVKLLVTKPGRLTTEFLAGRRARFISPVRLYLTCSLIFFAL